jgi:hypothetical protein
VLRSTARSQSRSWSSLAIRDTRGSPVVWRQSREFAENPWCVLHLARWKAWCAWPPVAADVSARQVLCQAELQPLAKPGVYQTSLIEAFSSESCGFVGSKTLDFGRRFAAFLVAFLVETQFRAIRCRGD